MNALEKIKEGVSDGVKAVEGKLALVENNIAEAKAQKELQKAEEKAQKDKERLIKEKEREKAAKAKERAKNRKRRSLAVRRFFAGVLSGLIIIAVGVWYTLGGIGATVPEMPVTPLWALGLMAVSAVSMITGRLIPLKAGGAILGALVLIRDNGWLWGILGSVSIWKLIAATAVIVAIICVTCLIVNIRNGARKGWGKVATTVKNARTNVGKWFEKTKQKLKNIKK